MIVKKMETNLLTQLQRNALHFQKYKTVMSVERFFGTCLKPKDGP